VKKKGRVALESVVSEVVERACPQREPMGLCLSVFDYLTQSSLSWRAFRIGYLPFSEQTPSAPSGGRGFPRGRKRGGLRNRREMVGTGRNSWRTDTMGLGGGPQGRNLFPQAGRLFPSRSLDSDYAEGACSSAGANGPLPVWFRLLNPTFSLYENI